MQTGPSNQIKTGASFWNGPKTPAMSHKTGASFWQGPPSSHVDNIKTGASFWHGPKTPLVEGQDPNYQNKGINIVNHFVLMPNQRIMSIHLEATVYCAGKVVNL